ncbi:MAG: cysteine desulfurase family protein [Candidatus Paceibacterota bacterium]
MKEKREKIYLDYAAATPVRSEVLEAMQPYWQEKFANTQSTHAAGQAAADAVTKARRTVAEVLSVQQSEIVFTSGATEANSLALLGVVRAAGKIKNPNIIVSEVAHGSVRYIRESYGDEIEIITVPVDVTGRLEVAVLEDLINDQTVLVSCSHANSEIGTIQPVAAIADAVKKYRTEQRGTYPLLHVDASQSVLYETVRPEALGIDLLTLNGQKMYGPKGVGMLWVRRGTPLASLFISSSRRQVGDYQRLRPGTPATPLIVGFADSLSWAAEHRQKHKKKVIAQRDNFISLLKDLFPDVIINGSQKNRIAHNISITFPDTDHDYLATRLDTLGIAVATTSACQADKSHGSEILKHLQQDEAIRISIGIETKRAELDSVLAVLEEIL